MPCPTVVGFRRLQQWCNQHHWPLVWALGPGANETSFLGLDRIVDIPTLASVSPINRTADSTVAAAFKRLWDEQQVCESTS